MLGRLEALGKLKVGCLGGSMSILPPWSMAAERPCMSARDCKCRYRSMVQLCHLPRRRMRLLSTPPQNSAMAPVERRQPALTSSGPMPNSAPCTRAADFRAMVMSLLLMYHRGPEGISWYVPNGASWGAPCLRSNKQISAKPMTGHAWRALLRACPTISPGTPLFCTVNVIPDQSAERIWEAFASNTSNWSCPI